MASLLLGRKKSSFSKSNFPDEDTFSKLLIEEEETPFSTSSSEVPPHRRYMKKQVSFDSPPCAIKTITDNREEDEEDKGEDEVVEDNKEELGEEDKNTQENTIRL